MLAHNSNKIGSIEMFNRKINELSNKLSVLGCIDKTIAISCRHPRMIVLRSRKRLVVQHTSLLKQIKHMLPLGEVNGFIGTENLNPKERPKI